MHKTWIFLPNVYVCSLLLKCLCTAESWIMPSLLPGMIYYFSRFQRKKMSRDFSEVILSEDEGNSTTQISLAWSTFSQGLFKDNLRTQWISIFFFNFSTTELLWPYMCDAWKEFLKENKFWSSFWNLSILLLMYPQIFRMKKRNCTNSHERESKQKSWD